MKGMVEIPLSNGMIVIIDDEDYELASEVSSWCAHRGPKDRTYYARGRLPGGRKVLLHRWLMGEPVGQVDHENGFGLDNRRSNLRVATPKQNQGNARIRKDNTSGYKGVGWYKAGQQWRAYITVDKRLVHLGYFIDLTDAARAYDAAALEHFGEFAHLNFPGGD
jgi:hypothetical protein